MDRKLIPLDQLTINPEINPRHASDDDVSDLVAQIRANGFSDALWVRPGGDVTGDAIYEVIDGSRRLRAMRQVAAEQNLPGDHAVPCDVFDADVARARELALAANITRSDLSPADEAVAFYRLKLSGVDEETIAAHFAVPERRVRQRIAIGQLPAKIIAALRDETIDIKTAEAFTISASPEQQLKVFGKGQNLNAHQVRQQLTQKRVSSKDPRVTFVGLEAYAAAGGKSDTNLFADESWLHDEKLLHKLFKAKLDDTVKTLKDEGWSFVKVLEGNEANSAYRYEQLQPRGKKELSADEEKRLAAIEAEIVKLRKEAAKLVDKRWKSELSEEEDERADALDEKIEALEKELEPLQAKPWTAKQMAECGVIITVPEFRGSQYHREIIEIRKGLMEPRVAAKKKKADKAKKGNGKAGEEERDTSYAEALEIAMVTAARNATKRAMIEDKLAFTLRAGLAARVGEFLQDFWSSPFEITFVLDEGGPTFVQACKAWRKAFKGCDSFAAIMAKLETMAPEDLQKLDAVITAATFSVDALRNSDAAWVIAQVDPDMSAEGFKIDAEFLSRMNREQLSLTAIDCGIDVPKGKKPDMVAALLPVIIKTGWLPAKLRYPSYKGPGSAHFKPAQPDVQESQAA
jgi:ParB/RepB/Spo0J family partition protein